MKSSGKYGSRIRHEITSVLKLVNDQDNCASIRVNGRQMEVGYSTLVGGYIDAFSPEDHCKEYIKKHPHRL